MKKLYKITPYVMLGLMVAGCTDLDTEPLSSTITSDQKEEVVESDPSRLEASVAAVAANFTQYAKIYTEDDNVHSDIGYPTIMLATESRGTDMVADITGYNWYSNSADYSDCLNTSTATIEFWGTLYNQIFTANNVIGTVDNETEDPTLQYYLAQALAVRAFDYFTLIQLYQFNYKGHESAMGMPLITEQNATEVAANGCARSTVQETYDFILADLNKAIELLTATTKERDDKRYVSLDVAYGIRARVYLAMHNYAEALKDAEAALAKTTATPYSRADVSKPSFINIEDNSWMWGILITEQDRVSTTGICNFPSHMGSLNYGYAILLSTVSKEIVNNGYLTQLGIHHKNEFNEFNLTCDLMEPFRVIIDNFVYFNKERNFDADYKIDILNVFNNTFRYQNKKYTLKDIIKMFVKHTLESINNYEDYRNFLYYEG